MDGSQGLRHLPYLDAVRGLACLGVFYNHMLPACPGANYFGWAGVELFFVLSGFLITRILLAERAAAERAGSKGPALISFYCRRALRIFPTYYLSVFALVLLKAPGIKSHLWYHLTYTYNFRLGMYSLEPSHARHFWSLCVEEQFYLFWPILMLFVPRRRLVWLTFGVAVVAPCSRLWFALQHHERHWLHMLTCCSLDCLAFGALLAHVENRVGTHGLLRSRFVSACKWLGALLMLGYLYLSSRATALAFPAWFGSLDVVWIVGNTCLAVFFTYVVALSCVPPPGDWERVISMNWLRFTGRISYGLYVYHMILIYQWTYRVPAGKSPLACPEVVICLPVSMLLAIVSWYGLERPILRWKDRFAQERIREWWNPQQTKGGKLEVRRAA